MQRDSQEYGAVFSLLRVFPAIIDQKLRREQLFRELLSFKTPQVLADFSFLTFRLAGNVEDALFEYSGAISKTRQLTGSNRGDPLLVFPFSLDDLMGWSGKIENLDAELSETVKAFAPFQGTEPVSISKAEGTECVGLQDGKSPLVQWNFDKHSVAGAGWLPVSSTYAERNLFRIEASSRDPYSLSGRQVIYIDRDSMMPVYRIVYDRGGDLWKIVISGNAMFKASDSVEPFQAFEVVIDLKSDRAALLSLKSFEYCKVPPETFNLSLLDPAKMKGTHEVKAPQATPTAQPSGRKKGEREDDVVRD